MAKRRSFRKKSKSYRKKRRVSRKKSPLRKLIQREISRNVENKCSQHYDYDQRLYSAVNANFPADNIIVLGPDPTSLVINQGTGQGNRIGNSITTKKFVFRGTLVPLPYDATFNAAPQPVQVRMVIFYDKTDPTAIPNPIAGNDFFQNGNTSKGFQNDLTDLWSPVNKDRYRVLATRTFKLGMAAYSGTGTNPGQQSFTNNDFKLNCNFSFNLTKHYPKIVKFNDGTATPTTRGLFCMFYYALANGGSVPGSAYMVGAQYMQDYTYEDA